LIKKGAPAGHKVEVFRNAICIGKVRGSADVIISRTDGKRNTILTASTNDTKLNGKISIAKPNIKRLGDPVGLQQDPEAESGARRLLRACKTASNRLDYLVVERFNTMDTGAYAMWQGKDLPSKNRPRLPVRLAVFVGAKSNGAKMDLTDDFYSVLAHEGGHALADVMHPKSTDPHAKTDWMHNYENKTWKPTVSRRKRIEDKPIIEVEFEIAKAAAPYYKYKKINPTARLRGFGASCIARW
ncbi:MAG: hypothetical protein K8E66_10335, partial [Phycisphaerales bacterium]|nr:hypothetical protein [Phycisphaerales bacterium]